MLAKLDCANHAVNFSNVNLLNLSKVLILGISFLTSFLLPLRVVLVAKLVISGILSSIYLILTLDFKLAKSTFIENFDESTPVAFFNLLLLHNLINQIQLSPFLLKISAVGNIYPFILCLLYQSNC